MKKKTLDDMLVRYADAVIQGEDTARFAHHAAAWGEEGEALMNTIQTLRQALRPVPVPSALADKVRQQVRQEILGTLTPAKAAQVGTVSRLGSAVRAFLRRAGELVVNINLRELFGAGAGQPAPVYAFSAVEALDKAARRRKARILLDPQGRIYEIPITVLKRYQVKRKA